MQRESIQDFLNAVYFMTHIVLFEPEIPPNTGNIIRLAANSGCQLHLIEPLGFELDDKRLRRAGLDYREFREILIHQHWQAFIERQQPQRLFAISTKGTEHYHHISYRSDDYLIFGPETRGLPDSILSSSSIDIVLRIPMQRNNRSINLANAVAIVVYEAWRQQGFAGGN